jgi:hypothetical protein
VLAVCTGSISDHAGPDNRCHRQSGTSVWWLRRRGSTSVHVYTYALVDEILALDWLPVTVGRCAVSVLAACNTV